jgi:hypothetical protein
MAPLDVLLKPKECVMLLIDFQAGLGFGAESASRQVVLVPQETTDLLAPMKRFGWIIHCTSKSERQLELITLTMAVLLRTVC